MLASRLISILEPRMLHAKSIRMINLDKLSNKRITRLESDIELTNEEFESRLINRNPRNLEQLSFEKKPTGFWLDRSPPAYWNIVIFEQDGNHLHAHLRHWSGHNILTTSTSESQLQKYFKSSTSVQAATILGQILARRCLLSGYLCAGVEEVVEEKMGIKRIAFLDALKSSGFAIQEPPEIEPRSGTDL